MRDTSLRVPSGVYGTVIDAQVYSRESSDRDERLQSIIEAKRKKLEKDFGVEQNVIKNNALDKLKEVLIGKTTTGVLLSEDGFETTFEQEAKRSKVKTLRRSRSELARHYVPPWILEPGIPSAAALSMARAIRLDAA